jgi:hypothetical protein
MSAATTFVPAEKQDQHPGDTGMKTRLRCVGTLLETLWRVRDAMNQGTPLPDASEVLEGLKASMIGVFGNFNVEATPVRSGWRLLGWRVTTHDRTTSLQHHFYVHEGHIHHLQFQASPPWDHLSQFVVGSKVKRLAEDEKRAILQTISDSTAGVSVRSETS